MTEAKEHFTIIYHYADSNTFARVEHWELSRNEVVERCRFIFKDDAKYNKAIVLRNNTVFSITNQAVEEFGPTTQYINLAE